MMHLLVAALLATGVCDPSAGLPCDPQDEVPPVEVKAANDEQKEWYGGQTLVVDGVSFGAALLFPPLGLTTYLIGGPGTHLSHGRPGMALLDLGLRVALPLAGFLIGSAASSCHSSGEGVPCGLFGAGIGVLIGAATASMIDVFALSYAPVKPTMSVWKGSEGAMHTALGLSARF
jgi:hypothetical protein